MEAATVGGTDILVVVAVDFASGHMPSLGLSEHRVERPLFRPLPLHLGREVGEREHDLVHGGVQRALPVFQIKEYSHASVHDLFKRVGRLDLLAPQARLLAHDEDLERRAGLERVHEPDEAGTLDEFGTGDSIVHTDVVLSDRPASLCRVGSCALNLPGDGLLFLAHPICSVDFLA
ncbi:MAG: hypothetical protein V3R16_02940 [Nitrospirales bacterium]